MTQRLSSTKSAMKDLYASKHEGWVPPSDVSAVSSASSTSTASIPIPTKKPSHYNHDDLEEEDNELPNRLMDAELKDLCMQERIYGYSVMDPATTSPGIKQQAMDLDHAHAKLLRDHRSSRAAVGPPLTVTFTNQQDSMEETAVFDFEL